MKYVMPIVLLCCMNMHKVECAQEASSLIPFSKKIGEPLALGTAVGAGLWAVATPLAWASYSGRDRGSVGEWFVQTQPTVACIYGVLGLGLAASRPELEARAFGIGFAALPAVVVLATYMNKK